MKNAFLLVMLLCVGTALWAQKTYFIYIQSETQSPFYVKMGGRVFSASSSGYLLLSQLHDSTYNIQVGPSATDGELQFSVTVRQADRGFLLKKFSEGWGLFDLQSMQVTRPTNSAAGYSSGRRVRDDRFTHLLAEAADDTTLFYQPVMAGATPAKKSDVKIEAETPSSKQPTTPAATASVQQPADTVAANNASSVTAAPVEATVAIGQQADFQKDAGTRRDTAAAQNMAVEKTENVVASANSKEADSAVQGEPEGAEDVVYKRSKITRRAESSTVDGFGLVYWDEAGGVVDTIQIFIPNQKFVFASPATTEDSTADMQQKAKPAAAVNQAEKTTVEKSCSGKATDKDFFRIRKSLVSYDSETQMVIAARSSFRNKCFSVDQIKNLSALFLTQEGKWQFLEAAYAHVPDKAAFSGLQSELRDEPYLSRFKALVGN